MMLQIVNDMKFMVSYDLIINKQKTLHQQQDIDKVIYLDLSSYGPTVNIKLFKENLWTQTSIIKVFFLFIYGMDWAFGNFYEDSNLPFGIHYQTNILNIESMPSIKINLSSIIDLESKSLFLWNKFSLIQSISISLFIFFIGIILSFIFHNWVKFLFISVIAVLSCFSFYLINKKRKQIFAYMKAFIQD